ncbi:TldD/PmbA family protein [Butyrivibrio sp. AE3006]|uniref:TldD/PmbA family protein n=1 Tax=Butyrivibrio sp. AE3006 TaxID=1280673 RepID=UPI0004161551|nr:TldD/PmbA family protein [Butyrivibrio sp. AE3006]
MLTDIYEVNKALFEDGVQTVLRAQENRYRTVSILKGNLVNNSRRESRGVSALVGKEGLYGFASIAECSDEAAKKVLKSASENAKLMARHAGNKGIVLPPSYGTGLVPTNGDIVDAEQKKIIDACRKMDDYIAQKYPNLESRSIYYSEDSQDRIIYSSDAYDGHLVTPRTCMYVGMSLKTKDGTPVECYKGLGGFGNFEDNFADVEQYYPELEKLYKKVKDKSEGVYAEAGYKTVVLGGDMGGMLAHEAVGHTVEADLVMGGSVAGPNLGKRVASDLVTLVDFAHTYNGERAPLPVYLDDEGIKAEDAVLIKDGILTGYMNNRETAEKFGMKPTGNARGWAFCDEPLIRMRNTCILPGKNTVEELIESVDDGYYLINSGNGQADLTGEFMFSVVCGYEIKNGKLGRALLDTTVSGIAFDMLKTVDMVSNEVEWTGCGWCGKKQQMAVGMGGPHMRCKIMIGGR